MAKKREHRKPPRVKRKDSVEQDPTQHEIDVQRLRKLKERRKGKKYKLVQIDHRTWHEVEVKDELTDV